MTRGRSLRRLRTGAARVLLRSSCVEALGRRRAFEIRLGAARILLRSEAGGRRRDGSRSDGELLDAVPDALGRLAERLPHGTVLVSATNGKTTTTAMITAILERCGFAVLTSAVGANQASGIAAVLLEVSRPGGRIGGDYGVFEVDELWLPEVASQVKPCVLVLGNLFRDQLDRHGEIEIVAERWSKMLDTCSSDMRLVVCVDDARLASLAAARRSVVTFGLDDDAVALEGLPHAADTAECSRCGVRHEYDAVYVAHLGRYHCRSCDERRPIPDVFASGIEIAGMDGSSFRLCTPGGSAVVPLRVPGVFNVYNAVAAAAAGYALGASPATVATALSHVAPVFGRAERISVGSNELLVLLAKNPAGMNEMVRTLTHDAHGAPLDLVMLLNDSVYDGRDVSWIWDADLEPLAGRVRGVVCGGSRGAEMALRLKYAGVSASVLRLEDTIGGALDAALRTRDSCVHVVANYTAMLDVRDLLVDRGHVASVWR